MDADRAVNGEKSVLLGLPEITYKPGWTFEWRPSDYDGHPVLIIVADSPDSKGLNSLTGEPRGGVEWLFDAPLPFDPQWLRDLLREMEDHERDEWIVVDGDRAFWPHKDESREL